MFIPELALGQGRQVDRLGPKSEGVKKILNK